MKQTKIFTIFIIITTLMLTTLLEFSIDAQANAVIKNGVWIRLENDNLWIRKGNPSIDILDVLKRCREFIDDYYSDLNYITTSDGTAMGDSQYDELVDLDRVDTSSIERLKRKIKKRHRERQLRNDIETIINLIVEQKAK